jgi:nucleoid DNA-binding protein
MTLLVCLCGSPLTPRIGGVRGGDTFNRELTALLDSLRKVLDRLEDIRSDRSVLAGLAGQPASPEAFAALVSRSENVERVLAQRIRRRPGRGRHWRSPKRKPRAKGRDQLVLAVEQRAGLTARKAREVVNQFWNIITRAIWRGENVETPLGVFKARSGTRTQQTRTRWGRQQTLYRQERRIAFRPSIAFPVISETPASKEDSVPQANVPSNQLICEKCGSTHFIEAKFRRYQEQYASTPGADFVAVTEDPIRALVCMCGHPIQPRQHRSLSISARDWGGFQKSFESARRYRQAAEPQTIVDRISPPDPTPSPDPPPFETGP